MRCPFCQANEDKVVDSRESQDGISVRRRRECEKCGKRFTTYEEVDEIPFMVIKRDGRREKFDSKKLLSGLMRACEKRPIPAREMDELVNEIEAMVQARAEREIPTKELGNFIMNRLKDLDGVAYVRFASVYRKFEDISAFMDEIRELLQKKEEKK